jgi:hypothetical protein
MIKMVQFSDLVVDCMGFGIMEKDKVIRFYVLVLGNCWRRNNMEYANVDSVGIVIVVFRSWAVVRFVGPL